MVSSSLTKDQRIFLRISASKKRWYFFETSVWMDWAVLETRTDQWKSFFFLKLYLGTYCHREQWWRSWWLWSWTFYTYFWTLNLQHAFLKVSFIVLLQYFWDFSDQTEKLRNIFRLLVYLSFKQKQAWTKVFQ